MVLGLILPMGLMSALTGCERKAIPPRLEAAQVPAERPEQWLTGGTLVFEDTFERQSLGEAWLPHESDWHLKAGGVHSTRARNAGLWLVKPLPGNVRVEFDAMSSSRGTTKAFEGDLKCEIFATDPSHQSGYILVNGGWGNQLDIIARLDEHGTDRAEQPAAPVEEGRSYRWAIVRKNQEIYWFRDGALHMQYTDNDPIEGHHFGFNNWESHASFDNLRVYDLSPQ